MKIACPLGDMFMTAAYAPSGRATCKGCQAKIGKDELRLSNVIDEDHYHQEHHYHADCFSLKSAFKNATYKDIFHVENLTKEDQEKVKAILEKLQKKEIKKKPQQKKVNAKSKSTKPKKSDVEDDSDSDYDYKKDKNQKDNKQSKALKSKKVEASKKSESSESESDDEEPDVFVLYDKVQKEEFRKIQQELDKKSAGQLKQMLKANDQKQTGNKGELIERIADCMIKGCLEKCPNCSGGRPKLNPVQKNFKCPGYMDDTEFRFCNKVYGPKDLKRIPWVDV
ncbi:unnamed protein product (macronuclear) [Paramecium tetraurelia]|uniref:NAD(+) ADP-ribosyltransferase n=1 Tax=Paramecium tetraurelia TaxID=5888 RepID=A0CXH1_PARTE|nr:uncharacterized protein GSPATT00011120001 [Paramecium tetraurelia]CAK75488.1 unnamed protein product [Paramecium tetraurelia]|eukprot:XP_001442885.1 hypothetical protein (macronuclear) [Paramecium tetraurelia strain d4-2]